MQKNNRKYTKLDTQHDDRARPKCSSPLGTEILERERIVSQIHNADSARLILIHAPAGFGKTTVMKQYLQAQSHKGIPTAWLTMDGSDNDVSRFIPYLCSALRDLGIYVNQVSHSPKSLSKVAGTREAAPNLVASLSKHDEPFALFIDDLEVISNPTVLKLLGLIVNYLPQHGKIITASRIVPKMDLGRLRAHGDVLEITSDDLRFSFDESERFICHHLGTGMSEEDMDWLHQKTEGWVAALWLASLALKRSDNHQQFIEAYNGSNSMIMEYLFEDVISKQSESVKSFLLETSILKELTAPLCNQITEREDSQEILEYIERANLFLTRQDYGGKRFRYHKLFSDALCMQLKRRFPDALYGLHRRASDWYLSVGKVAPAIEHAMHAKDYKQALSLLGTYGSELLSQGRVRMLARWFDLLEENYPQHMHPHHIIVYAWALTFTHRHQEADAQLVRIRNQLAADRTTNAEIIWQVDTIQSFGYAVTDRIEEAYVGWQTLAEKLTDSSDYAYDFFISSYAFCLIAASRFDEAQKVIDRGKKQDQAFGKVLNHTMSMCIEGTLQLVQGRLQKAISWYNTALDGRGAGTRERRVSGTIAASAYLAEALYELNELDKVERLLTAYLPLLTEIVAPDQIITSYIALARVAFHKGDQSRMNSLLEQLETIGNIRGLGRLVASADLERGRVALNRGDINAAKRHLASAKNARLNYHGDRFIMLADDVETPEMLEFRIRIRSGQTEGVVCDIKQALKFAGRLQRFRRVLKLKILLAEALHATGEANLAMRQIVEALELGSTENFLRAFLDESAQVLRLVANFRQMMAEGDKISETVDRFVNHILELSEYDADEISIISNTTTKNTHFEDLSDRERQVLLLLGEGHQNRVIAEKLFVSETTVKAHLRNIYTKLDAHNRTQAVSIARNLGLVSV